MKEVRWYPGNMARTMRRLREDLRVIDLVVELRDARVPRSSHNPRLADLIAGKEQLVLLHKADQAENSATERWLAYLESRGIPAMAYSVHRQRSLTSLMRFLNGKARSLLPYRIKRPLRIMIVGIPNVGKSTLINHLVKRGVAPTGNRPGITRGKQWIRLLPGVELLDTPGVLWPDLSPETVLPLGVVGALPPEVVGGEKLALWLLEAFVRRGKAGRLSRRYPGAEPEHQPPEIFLEHIGQRLGCLLPGGKVDRERAAALLLKDFQGGGLGPLTLEEPPLPEEEEAQGEEDV
ncbi:MAG TPA: ribosome biogenesis GTPase YlqF [Bacillota bacterium]|jgi:ribosome biogenesis GTPase A|nr:ribosome biogenesis GTPase YlqF [Bacillota bacterium]HOP68792.1 ribosome biogenesis GTPase YlqF [Bacillota bacterium]HPT33841.1 ribosome biogenesis GTPase YlqF [Bacillota bacterium]HQD06459.1 ribosome biogenesis GTPase YlqF [Bacillota bacterium]